MLTDTHCHIHEVKYPLDIGDTIARARQAGVSTLICVGTNEQDSKEAIAFAAQHDHVVASVGVHPHDTKDGYGIIAKLAIDKQVVAIGEVGLDYFYTHSPREIQITALEAQLQIAQDNQLPVIFHVRESFDDFWPIFRNFSGLTGVLHSFTDSIENMEKAISRGLYIGVNGISTFARDKQAMFDAVPLEKMVLETDAPFLTPVPYRGKVNEPAFVRVVAEYHASRRDISLEEIAAITTKNARTLFSF